MGCVRPASSACRPVRGAAGAVAGAGQEPARLGGRAGHGRGTADEPGRSGLLRAGGRARGGLAERAAPDAHPARAEVAALVAQGRTNRGIAGQLHLSVRTVDTHVDHVLTKLGFSNRAQLVAWAYESGLAPKDT